MIIHLRSPIAEYPRLTTTTSCSPLPRQTYYSTTLHPSEPEAHTLSYQATQPPSSTQPSRNAFAGKPAPGTKSAGLRTKPNNRTPTSDNNHFLLHTPSTILTTQQQSSLPNPKPTPSLPATQPRSPPATQLPSFTSLLSPQVRSPHFYSSDSAPVIFCTPPLLLFLFPSATGIHPDCPTRCIHSGKTPC
jgi:hypothetical protein